MELFDEHFLENHMEVSADAHAGLNMFEQIVKNLPNHKKHVLDKDLNFLFTDSCCYDEIVSNSGEELNYLTQFPIDLQKDIQQKLQNVFKGNNTYFELKTDQEHYIFNAIGLKDIFGETRKIFVVKQVFHLNEVQNSHSYTSHNSRESALYKDKFFAMTSHQLRTPLTNILSSSSLLSRYVGKENLEEKKHKHLNLINKSVLQLDTLLKDYLILEKILDNRIEITNEKFNIQEFCEEIISRTQDSIDRIHKVNHHHSGNPIINMDKTIFHFIFERLLSNAIKYSPEYSEIRIGTFTTNESIQIKIKDSGIGIPERDQERIFDNYFRAENTKEIPGTGLGLSIIKKYLDLLHGSIHIVSEENIGTLIHIVIPNTDNTNEF